MQIPTSRRRSTSLRSSAVRSSALALAAVGLLVGVGACSGSAEGDAPGDVEPVGTEEGAATTVTLAVSGALSTNDLRVTDTPKLVASATGDLACGPGVEHDGAVRSVCTRGSEVVDFMYTRAKKSAVLVHRPAGVRVDRRTFFTCKAKGRVAAGALPSALTCSSASAARPGGGGLSSPFASTVDGITIPNAHAVGDPANEVLRGMAPRSDAELASLIDAGVGAVLVFKNQTGTGHDVADEMNELVAAGLDADDVKNIPFQWKDLTGFKDTCEQTIDGLRFIEEKRAAGKKVFFHCTVGEDRTGFLAALHRLVEDGGDARAMFEDEMCERGYGAGNPLKPYRAVVEKLDAGLTPMYTKLAFLVRTGAIAKGHLDRTVCRKDPANDAAFKAATDLRAEDFRCSTSTNYTPVP